MSKKNISSSIAVKLAVVFIFFAVFQNILLASFMIWGGVLKQAESNQYSFFAEKVNGRSNNLENEMKNIWTNLDYDLERLNWYMEEASTDGQQETADQLLEKMAPLMMDALSRTKTTGAFLVIPEPDSGTDNAFPALYFRNNNPDRNSRENSNFYMLIGPWNVAEKMAIATTANWSFRLNIDEANRNFVCKPCEAARDIGKSKWLGYWSAPFKVNPGDEEVITYSVPLFDVDGNVKAIFGVEIAVNYLYHFLPASDLQASDSYGYMIGVKDENGALRAEVTHGAMQERMLEKGKPLELKAVDEERSIYRLLNHNSSEEIYACVNPMGMYYHNTPFEGEEWMLIGLMEKPDLLQFPEKIGRILNYSLLFTLAIGAATAIMTSQWFTRHAKLIELSGLPVGAIDFGGRRGRVCMTSQIPRLLNLTREQERRFSRDKEQFLSFIEALMPSETGEEGVYRMESNGRLRYIKITCKASVSRQIRVVEDVTDEVLQTRKLKKERDRDALTGIKNRRAFQAAVTALNAGLERQQRIALVMCDLNDLKGVNDKFGHDKGDAYIRMAAECIQKAFPEGQVFRIGGDEFAIMIQDVLTGEIRESLDVMASMMEEYSRECSFDASIAAGFAFYDPDTDARLEDTLARADAVMYEKKRAMYEKKHAVKQ